MWDILVEISRPLVIVMVIVAMMVTWRPEILTGHREHGLSIAWTRTLFGITLVVVLVMFALVK